MNQKTLLFIILLIVVILIVLWIIKFRKRKNDIIIMVSGKLGGGKTFTCVNDCLADYSKSLREWKKVNQPCLFRRIIRFIPYFKNLNMKKELYGLSKPELYSNFPILIKHKKNCDILSKPITNDIMLLNDSIPLNSIVVIDEFSSWISQFEFKESFTEALNDHIQKWRHYHGDYSRLYVIDQSSDNIPLQVRRRCNKVLYCESVKHYLKFIHILRYKYIELTEDIKTIEINGSKDLSNTEEDSDDKVSKRLIFSIRKKYDSRAYSNRYRFVKNAIADKNCKYINSNLKTDNTLTSPKGLKGVVINDLIKKEDVKNEKIN